MSLDLVELATTRFTSVKYFPDRRICICNAPPCAQRDCKIPEPLAAALQFVALGVRLSILLDGQDLRSIKCIRAFIEVGGTCVHASDVLMYTAKSVYCPDGLVGLHFRSE